MKRICKEITKGFTLIEVLIGTAVLLTVGGTMAGVFASALRGQAKIDIITTVRQNGNLVTSQMVKNIRNARQFNGVSVAGATYTTTCFSAVGATTPTPTPVAYKYLSVTGADGGQTIYNCSATDIASNGASLLDTNKVKVDSCSISCSESSISGAHVISISFSLSQKTGSFAQDSASIPFQTSVQLRNENR